MSRVDNRELNARLESLRIEREPISPGPSKPRLLLLGLSTAVVLAAFAAMYVFPAAVEVEVGEVRVESGASGSTVLTASGYVVAAHKIAVGAKVLGRVTWIGVDKGDHVEQGDVLVRIEDADYRAQVAQASAAVTAAEARLDELRAGSRPQEKARSRAAVAEAEANLRNAELEYERALRLHRDGVGSKSEVDQALKQRDVATAQLEAARESSHLTEIGPRAEQIRAAEAELAQARANLDYANTQLSNTRIVAPVSGTILERIVERGEMVSPSAYGDSGARTAVVSLADLNDLQVELDISQADFAKLQMGQRAEIIPEAFPNLRFEGFIQEIAPEANRSKATVQVKVKIDKPTEQLRPEMNARVNFLAVEAARAPNATRRVLTPTSAVVREGEGTFVFVVKDGAVEKRVVRLGEVAGDAIVVLDGLSGGERVVTEGAEQLRDGSRVTVRI